MLHLPSHQPLITRLGGKEYGRIDQAQFGGIFHERRFSRRWRGVALDPSNPSDPKTQLTNMNSGVFYARSSIFGLAQLQ